VVTLGGTRAGPSAVAGSGDLPAPTERAGGRPPADRYLPGLDGLRGIAVLAVMAFHFGVPGVAGGLLGVDVFFVLSGFLVTSLLLGELDRSGTISLRQFWARRARRLLPGLFVLLAGICAYAAWLATGDVLGQLRGDALATLAYVANWHYIVAGQGYFVRYGAPSPLLHTWSLAVEEQFYLVWPIAALAVGRRFGARGLTWLAGLLGAASAALCAVLSVTGASVDRLYYGTDTRAQAIMVGALLAAAMARSRSGAPRHRRAARAGPAWGRRALALAGVAGAGVVGWALHAVQGDGHFLYRGGFLVVAASAGAVVAVVATQPRSLLTRALSWRPLRYTGRISYGLYLYHWPLFLVIDHAHTGLQGAPLLAARVAATFLLADVSLRLWERPVRTGVLLSGRRALAAVPVGAAAVVLGLVGTTAAPLVASAEAPSPLAARQAAHQALPPGVSAAHPERALLLGDSMALTLGWGLSRDAPAWGVSVLNKGSVGCDLDPSTTVDVMGTIGPAAQGCPDWRHAWAGLVARTDPDVVMVLLGRWECLDRIYDGRWVHLGDRSYDDHLLGELEQVIDIASAHGARVAMLTLPYIVQTTEQPDGSPWPMNLPVRTDVYNELVRRAVAARPGRAVVVDLNRMLDPRGRYTSYLGGVRVRADDDEHLSVAGGEHLRPELLPELVSLGLGHAQARLAGATEVAVRPAVKPGGAIPPP